MHWKVKRVIMKIIKSLIYKNLIHLIHLVVTKEVVKTLIVIHLSLVRKRRKVERIKI
jgi:hypothetical protein